jgi:hypothetical protein
MSLDVQGWVKGGHTGEVCGDLKRDEHSPKGPYQSFPLPSRTWWVRRRCTDAIRAP